jgi:hypothetical protein
MRVTRLFLGVVVACSIVAAACVTPPGAPSGNPAPPPPYTPPGTPFGPWHDPLVRSDGEPLADRNAAITAMSTDGRFLGFTSREDVIVDQPDEVDGNREAYILDRDTDTVRWLPDSVPASRLGGSEDWTPYFIKVSDDGQTALLGNYDYTPDPYVNDPDSEGLSYISGDVFVYDVAGSSIDTSTDADCYEEIKPHYLPSQRFCTYGTVKDLSADGQFLVYAVADEALSVETIVLRNRETGEMTVLGEFPLTLLGEEYVGVYHVAYEDETGLINLTETDAQGKKTSLTYDQAGNLVSTHARPAFGDYRDQAEGGGYVYGENRCASMFASRWELIITKLFDTWGMADLGTPAPPEVTEENGFENLGNSAWAVEGRTGFPGASPIGPESQWQARHYTKSMSNDCSRMVAVQQTKTISGSLTLNVFQTEKPARAIYMMDVDSKLLRPLTAPGEFYSSQWWIIGPGHSATWIMRADGMEVANGNLVRSLN